MERVQKVEIGKVLFEIELHMAKLNVHTDHLGEIPERHQLFRHINYINNDIAQIRALLNNATITENS